MTIPFKEGTHTTMNEIRCKGIYRGKPCNRLLGYIDGEYEIKCPKCGEMNTKEYGRQNKCWEDNATCEIRPSITGSPYPYAFYKCRKGNRISNTCLNEDSTIEQQTACLVQAINELCDGCQVNKK